MDTVRAAPQTAFQRRAMVRHDLDYKEIAEVLNVSVSRISQLHTGIIAKLKERLVKEHI